MVVYAAVLGVNTEISDQPTTRNILGTMSIKRRLHLLSEIVQEAMAQLLQQALTQPVGTELVYVFLAPEYYFSAGSDLHLVTRDEKETILGKVKSLSAMYQDLILIPGTLPYYRRAEARDVQKYPGFASKYIAHNAAYVIRGGVKEHKYNKKDDAAEVLAAESRGGQVQYRGGTSSGQFSVANLRLGLEVCADHASGQLLAEAGQFVDLHLIVSASVGVRADRICARDAGYVLHACAGTLPCVYQISRNVLTQAVTNTVGLNGLSGRVQPFADVVATTFQGLQDHLDKFKKISKRRLAEARRPDVRSYKAHYQTGGNGPTPAQYKQSVETRDDQKLTHLMNNVGGTLSLYELPM